MSGDTPSVNAVKPLNAAQQQCLQAYTGMVGLDDALYNCGGSFYPNSIMSPLLTGGFNGMMMPGMYGGMYGYGPGSEIMKMSMEDYMQYQTKLQKMQTKYQVEQAHQIEGAKFSIEAPNNTIKMQVGLLKEAFKKHELENVPALLNNVEQAISDKYNEAGCTNVSADRTRSDAMLVYAAEGGDGSNLLNDIRKYCKDSFGKGFMNGLFGIGLLTDKKSSDELISEITGTEQTDASKASGVVGTIMGALTAVLCVGAAILGVKGLSKLPALRAESQAAQATNKLFANSGKVIASGREALASLEQRIIKEHNLTELANEYKMSLPEALESWLGANKNNPLTIMHNKLNGKITGIETEIATRKFDTLMSRFDQGMKSFGIAGSSA